MTNKSLEKLSEEEMRKLKSINSHRYLESKFITHFRDYWDWKNATFNKTNKI